MQTDTVPCDVSPGLGGMRLARDCWDTSPIDVSRNSGRRQVLNELRLWSKSNARGALAFAVAALGTVACGGGDDAREARSQAMATASTAATTIPNYTVVNLGNLGWVRPDGINASGQVAGYHYVRNELRAFHFDGSRLIDLRAPGGGSSSYAYTLNDSAQVVGDIDLADGISAAFAWTAQGGMKSISPATSSLASDINNNGLVVGRDTSGGFTWSMSGGYTSLTDFVPYAVNLSGQMVGYGYDPAMGWGYAMRQTNGSVTLLPPPAGNTYSAAATMLNDAGLAVGNAVSSPNSLPRATAWQAGSVYDIGAQLAAAQNDDVFASHVNQLGQVVGRHTKWNPLTGAPLGSNGFVWTIAGGAVDIGNLFPSDPYAHTHAMAINKHGQVVGEAASFQQSAVRAVMWTPATGLVDLNTRLVNPPQGLSLDRAVAISDDGSIVASFDSGLVLLRPIQSNTPASPPAIGPIVVGDPVPVRKQFTASVSFTDINVTDTHVAQWQWGDGTAPTAGRVNERSGSGSVTGSHEFSAAGVYTVSVTITDSSGLSATVSREVVVYDPVGGFAAGGGWLYSPMGAFRSDRTLAGRATFGFVSKHKKGAAAPAGDTAFHFQSAKLNFDSTSYDWLVFSGARAQYKGVGKLNGRPGYRFLLTAVDGALIAQGTPDRFRIKIWHFDAGQGVDVVDYDNQVDAGLEGSNQEGTVIGGGSIVIQK